MSEISNITAKGFELIKRKVIESYNSKGMKASGEFEQSLEVVEVPNGAQLIGAGHAVYLEFGRNSTPSGTSMGNPSLLEKIKEWVHDKGIVANDISEDSLIYLITRKIHREGWDRAQHGGVNLISDSIHENSFQPIIDEVFNREKNNITETLIKILK